MQGKQPTQQHELASLGVEPEKGGEAEDVLSRDTEPEADALEVKE